MKWVHAILPLVDLPPTERAVLWSLAFHHNDKSGLCYPGVKTLAVEAGACERRIKTAIQTLKAWSLIDATRGPGPIGNASNRYTLFGKPVRPKQRGKRVPVQRGTKKPVQRGTGVPVAKGHGLAHESVTSLKAHLAQARGLKIVGGCDA